jgi:hypothetical protein
MCPSSLELHPPANRCCRCRVQATQRAGRAGRTRPGTCYRLYTKKFFEREMPNTVRVGVGGFRFSCHPASLSFLSSSAPRELPA